MKKLFTNVEKTWKAYALAGCVCILFYLIIGHLGLVCSYIGKFLQFFSSVFIGVIIAYIINPFAKAVENLLFKRLKEKKEQTAWVLSVAICFVIILAFVTCIIIVLIPQVIDSVGGLINNLSYYMENMDSITGNLKEPIKGYVEKAVRLIVSENGWLSNLESILKDNLSKIISATSKVSGVAINWAIGLILSLYFLCAKKNITKGFVDFYQLAVSKTTYGRTHLFYAKFDAIFSKYIICELVDGLIVGVANLIFLIIFRIPSALVISVVAGLTNLIPTFGPIIGGAIGVFLLLLMKPSAILPFLIFTVFIQTCDAYLIKPKFFGSAMDVPGFLILVAVIVFGKMFGITGMLLAIPFAAIIVYLFTEILTPRLEARKYKREMEKQSDEEQSNQLKETE